MLYVLSAMRLFNNVDNLLVDVFSHFPVQYAFLAFVLCSICLWKKYFPLAVLAGFLFIFNARVLVDLETSVQAARHNEATFKIYSANIERNNRNLSGLTSELNKIDPDIVLLTEVTPGHINQLQKTIESFPYHLECTPFGKLNIGTVLLSKFPIINYRYTQLSELGNLLVESMLNINQKKVMFYAIHATNPSLTKYFDDRQKQFLDLSDRISRQSMPTIIAGDFNATPYSPTFRRLLQATGLRDSRAGFGWQPSWPTYFPLFWLPIDHILVSPDFQVLLRTTGSYIGSDHYPVIAELSRPL